MSGSILESTAPKANQLFQVVVELSGPVEKAKFEEFIKAFKALADRYGAGIGARGAVDKATGRLEKPRTP